MKKRIMISVGITLILISTSIGMAININNKQKMVIQDM